MNTSKVSTDSQVEDIYQFIHAAKLWLIQDNIEAAEKSVNDAEFLALKLRHGPALDKAKGANYADYAVNDWVEVVLGNGMQPIKECCITAVKFSQGGHVHFDLIYVTHRDDDGVANYQKLYHVPTGMVNAASEE